MSEYQYVVFRAVDGPVTGKNLEFMQRQSSRAEITPWSFINQYHFGDFRGDALEMLRRGYDLHLHYANFGVRKLLIRVPHGLPDPEAAEPYLVEDGPKWIQDKTGPGGILSIDPYFEAGELDELWGLDEFLDRLVPLRAELLDGDVRPLYLAHLGVSGDGNHDPEETREGPVPAGLDKPTHAQRALADWLGIDKHLIAAAARGAPGLPSRDDAQTSYAEWLRGQPAATKDAWLAQLLADPTSTVKAEVLAELRKGRESTSWPTARLDRTVAELKAAAGQLGSAAATKAAAKAARDRAKMLAAMAADPRRTLGETEKLVSQRNTRSYEEAADLLADLREALAGGAEAGLAEEQARKLRAGHPTLHRLTAALRRKGFLKK